MQHQNRMSARRWLAPGVMLLLASFGAAAAPGPATQRLRNDQVAAVEFTVPPGEAASIDGRYPAATVYLEGGSVEFAPRGGGPASRCDVTRGDVVFSPAQAGSIRNVGTADVRFVRVEFLTPGSDTSWGAAGLAPDYRMLVENRYARIYDIRIPAGAREPQHTHKARVVVCLSGARLRHLMPDGREEPSTLQTGEVAWRLGATHIGENLGKTDLWVIAIEPKSGSRDK